MAASGATLPSGAGVVWPASAPPGWMTVGLPRHTPHERLQLAPRPEVDMLVRCLYLPNIVILDDVFRYLNEFIRQFGAENCQHLW